MSDYLSKFVLLDRFFVIKGSYEVCLFNQSENFAKELENLVFDDEQGNIFTPKLLERIPTSDSGTKLFFEMKIEESTRISISIRNENKFSFLHFKKKQVHNPYRAEFFDYCYSLRDHVKQLDLIRGFMYGNDESSKLFRALRHEIHANVASLSEQIGSLKSAKIEEEQK